VVRSVAFMNCRFLNKELILVILIISNLALYYTDRFNTKCERLLNFFYFCFELVIPNFYMCNSDMILVTQSYVLLCSIIVRNTHIWETKN